MLKDTWYFHCECERCLDNSEHILTSINCPNCPKNPYRLCLFGEWDYKDKETQLITCPQCKNQVDKDKVLEAIGAMKFIDNVLDKREVDQMPVKMAIEFLEDLIERFREMLPRVNVYFCKLVEVRETLVEV